MSEAIERIRSFAPSLFDDDLVTDTLIYIIVVDLLLCCKFSHIDMVFCSRNGVCRNLVVKEHDDMFRVKNLRTSHLVELPDSKRAGNVVDHCPVDRGHHNFACLYIPAALP